MTPWRSAFWRSRGAAAKDHAKADLLFRGGAVYTVDAARSWARAVAIRDGRIVYVGGDSVPLDRNLFDLPPHRIHEAKVVRTLVERRTVYRR